MHFIRRANRKHLSASWQFS